MFRFREINAEMPSAGEASGQMPVNELLTAWLRESDDGKADELLGLIMGGYAQPLVRRIVRFKLVSGAGPTGGDPAAADIDDVCQVVHHSVLAHLNRLKQGADTGAISNFLGYVSMTAQNACSEVFRNKKPARQSLSMKVRYVATHAPELALWDIGEVQEVCGYRRDHGSDPVTDIPRLNSASRELRRRQDPGRLTVAELVKFILNAAGGPLVFEVLVDAVADWSGLKEAHFCSLEEQTSEGIPLAERLKDRRPSAETQLINSEYMHQLWREIADLPLVQRRVVLLNLRSSAGGSIQLFDVLGIASVGGIADAVEMERLAFAKIWNELPFDDAQIARDLGLTAQDVANRRSSARQRLSRRMQKFMSTRLKNE